MRDPSIGLAATDVDDPLAEYRSIDERVAPEDVGDARMGAQEGPNRLVRNERHLAGDDRPQAVVHDLEVEALQVRNVAGNVEGDDLASTAGKELVAAGEAFKDRAALRGPVLIAKDVVVRPEISDRDRQRGDRALLVVQDGSDALQLSDQRVEMGIGWGQDRCSCG